MPDTVRTALLDARDEDFHAFQYAIERADTQVRPYELVKDDEV